MVTSIHSLGASLNGINPKGIDAAELYGRVSKTLLTQNASVQKLSAALTRDQTRLSGLGQLQSSLANFQALTQSLAGPGLQTAAIASNKAVLAALTTGTAKTGSYAVEVQQLAQSQVLGTRPQRSDTAAIGGGASTTIKIDVGTTSGSSFHPGGASKTITIDSSNNSLQGIAKAFQAAGVDAKVVRGSDGYTLQITAQSGEKNSLRISVGGDDALEGLLTYNPSGAQGLSQQRAAQDAQLTVDGKAITSDSNVITGAIQGTALALTAKGATSVTVAQDSSAIARNISNFVDGFNNLAARLKSLKQGDLKSDTAIGAVQDQILQLLARNNGALAGAGVSLDRNGTLQIDSKILNEAIVADPGKVSRLFTDGGKGLADQLGATIGRLIGENGAISKQKVAIDRGITALNTQKSTLTRALSAQAQQLVAQYTKVGEATSGNTALPGLPGGGATSLFDFLA
jgi:flagellar hook-associated protein 2